MTWSINSGTWAGKLGLWSSISREAEDIAGDGSDDTGLIVDGGRGVPGAIISKALMAEELSGPLTLTTNSFFERLSIGDFECHTSRLGE